MGAAARQAGHTPSALVSQGVRTNAPAPSLPPNPVVEVGSAAISLELPVPHELPPKPTEHPLSPHLPAATAGSAVGLREFRLSHHTSTAPMNPRSSEMNSSGEVSDCKRDVEVLRCFWLGLLRYGLRGQEHTDIGVAHSSVGA